MLHKIVIEAPTVHGNDTHYKDGLSVLQNVDLPLHMERKSYAPLSNI